MAITGAVSKYSLGLDIGSASIGWALIQLDELNNPVSLIKAGVRIFEPGVEGSALDIEQGKDKSKAVARREARLHRRQLRRRAARQRDLFALLQSKGLLPTKSEHSEANTSEQRHQILTDLDQALRRALLNGDNGSAVQSVNELLPYALRQQALDRKLEPFELGRVLYHLSQRRGFKSNRREGRKSEKQAEELGKVKQGISDLEKEIAATGSRTLGEYFAGLNPHLVRVRRRWTARRMYEQEFEAIWNAQIRYYPELLTADLKAEVARLLFYQRPIASQAHLIGFCELEPKERRAPWWTLEAQRFRLLQKINDLQIIYPGQIDGSSLSEEQRQKVLQQLEDGGDQTFAALKKLLRLPRQTQFNLEQGDERKLRGNRTNALMLRIFGPQWSELASEEKTELVRRWAETESPEELKDFAMREWALLDDAAAQWASIEPEDGYCSLSLVAIRKLLPIMEAGVSFKTAEKQIYGTRFSGKEPKGVVPPVREALPSLRNPAVERALTELRKVVNAIIRELGKPYEIRLEMARELRKPRKERLQAVKGNRSRERQRETLKARILKECGIQNPSRADIEKALLFEECGGICPYTGRAIEFTNLFQDSQFDVEHIVPVSRCPDDSFVNKTLCYHDENRRVKRGRTPWEAYGTDEQRWSEILLRVTKFDNPAKLRRFQLRTEQEVADFTARQMNDTRYTTRLAADLVGELYGGRDIANGDGINRRAIHASSGKITATLRRRWGLEAILREPTASPNGTNKGKARTDHRHHAVDAIAIALTTNSTIQRLSTAAAQAYGSGTSRVFESLSSPWPYFVDSIRPHVESMVVSHRPEHKMSGALHKETLYGRPYIFDGKSVVNLRRPLAGIPVTQIGAIVDPVVRQKVEAKLLEHGGDTKKFDPEKIESLPVLIGKDGRVMPIKRVRVREAKNDGTLDKLPGNRFVESESIHHFELFVRRENGREIWEHVSVSLLEAYERQRLGQNVVCRKMADVPEAEFLFSLMKGDTVELDYGGTRQIFRVKKFYSTGSIWFTHVNNAQKDEDQKKDRTRWSKRPDALRELKPRKVTIDLLGRVHPAND